MTTRIPLSVLDLAPMSQGMTRRAALDHSLQLAQLAEELGYHRYWMAEHHGSRTFMSSATALLLGRAAEHTSSIRLGAGGVMLPNHAPLMVAEYYGTLATIYGDRFDLGLGRAPGTDPITASALRRGSAQVVDFAEDVASLSQFLSPAPVEESQESVRGAELAALGLDPNPKDGRAWVRAIPGEGTQVPLWMLASSLAGAQVAAALGLPLSFASHFAPQLLGPAVSTYREQFRANAPTAQVAQPVVMAGVNVLVADSQSEAEELFTSYERMKARMRRGRSGPLTAPEPELAHPVNDPMEPTAVLGNQETVVDYLDNFVERYGLDELIVTSYAFDPAARRRSYELLAKQWSK
ncbi:MAG: LLM class flavin-dependent oxidoreductase [Actinomycetaceae bacterium]|nr:LLM class flavin-dependent oxidoreductase [Actinomycetaceae bacterium]